MPSRREGEPLEVFRERAREYMERRAIARGHRPIRRVGRPSLPREHSPHAPARIHYYKPEDWARRIAYREDVGLWPDRLKGIEDDRELVRAMRAERRRVAGG